MAVAWRKQLPESFPAGSLQSLFEIRFFKFQDGKPGVVCLFLNPHGLENAVNHRTHTTADLVCLAAHVFTIHLGLAEIRRHILLLRGVFALDLDREALMTGNVLATIVKWSFWLPSRAVLSGLYLPICAGKVELLIYTIYYYLRNGDYYANICP